MKKFPLTTPILFLIYNRPDTTEKVFNEIRKARPTKLFIASDGPRANNINDQKLCYLTKKIVKKVDWKCQVFTNFRDKNLGCKFAVFSAIDWFFKNIEAGIILEDDCLPNQSFFWFCQEMLTKYQDDKRIMQISGTNYFFGRKFGNASYYFSKLNDVWGWATWRRAWKYTDIKMKGYLEFKRQRKLEKYFNNIKIMAWMMNYLDEAYNSINSSKGIWSILWSYAIYKKKGLVIVPNINLVSNIGIDNRATHSGSTYKPFANIKTKEINKIIHPETIKYNKKADELFFDFISKVDPRLINKQPLRQKINEQINKLVNLLK